MKNLKKTKTCRKEQFSEWGGGEVIRVMTVGQADDDDYYYYYYYYYYYF